MASEQNEWRPGSFTKNFSWGSSREGLRQLHATIRIGFNDEVADVPRDVFRERVSKTGRPDFIPINFFLFNKIVDGDSYLIADELVFQALNFRHTSRFDKLGLFAFNFSLVGRWKGAKPYQRRPAEWARHYVMDRVSRDFNWDSSKISADDIEQFVSRHPRYKAEGARKLSTNLYYLYSIGGLKDFNTRNVSSWWLDALFLALDRVIEDRQSEQVRVDENRYTQYLYRSGFRELTGPRSTEKELAAKHLVDLYTACGARLRFSDEYVRERTEILVPELRWYVANNPEPIGAIHPTNPRAIKAIPRACAMLAKYIGFETLDIENWENFDVAEFVKQHTRRALRTLKDHDVVPTMSAEELLKLTRGK